VLEDLAQLPSAGLWLGLTLTGPRQGDTLRRALDVTVKKRLDSLAESANDYWNARARLARNCCPPWSAAGASLGRTLGVSMTRLFKFVTLFASFTSIFLAGNASAQSSESSGHGFAPVKGTRLYYEVKGTGPALVLIHGGQLDSRMWDDQFPLIAKQFTVLRYDVRGYGGSFQPDQLYSDADDLAALLDYLSVPNAHLVGLSLGGRIAVDFALAHPKRASSLTLAGPGLAGYEAPNSEEVDLRMWDLMKAARDEGPDKVTELWLKDPFMAPAMEQARLVPRLQRLSRENAHCWLRNPLLQRSPKPPAAKRLNEIQVPTLLVFGDRDLPQIKATIETLEKGINGSKKVVIKGAGHMVNMEKPEEFNEALLAFLSKLK
jgi:pimeloyl-ACP methyl ester carboxylesterase